MTNHVIMVAIVPSLIDTSIESTIKSTLYLLAEKPITKKHHPHQIAVEGIMLVFTYG